MVIQRIWMHHMQITTAWICVYSMKGDTHNIIHIQNTKRRRTQNNQKSKYETHVKRVWNNEDVQYRWTGTASRLRRCCYRCRQHRRNGAATTLKNFEWTLAKFSNLPSLRFCWFNLYSPAAKTHMANKTAMRACFWRFGTLIKVLTLFCARALLKIIEFYVFDICFYYFTIFGSKYCVCFLFFLLFSFFIMLFLSFLYMFFDTTPSPPSSIFLPDLQHNGHEFSNILVKSPQYDQICSNDLVCVCWPRNMDYTWLKNHIYTYTTHLITI